MTAASAGWFAVSAAPTRAKRKSRLMVSRHSLVLACSIIRNYRAVMLEKSLDDEPSTDPCGIIESLPGCLLACTYGKQATLEGH